MSTKDFTANVISATKVVPDGNFKDSKASGIWDINEALDLIKGGNWPNAANINPSAFVDALFSTFVYDGTSDTSLAINNDLDLTKGGLVWTKERTNNGGGNILFSTDASGNHSGLLFSNTTASAGSGYQPDYFTFRNNGYTTTNTVGDSKVNGREYVSWSFRNQPKFFDVVTYTGTGTPQNISHSLNSTVGMIAVKRTDATGNWAVYHRGANGGTDPEDYHAGFNLTDEFANNLGYWNDTAPTTTQFTVGDDSNVNANNGTYVAYLFAHNNDDGGFGEPGDQDIIKCGYYTGNGNATGPSVNLGFEPQWVLIKLASGSGENWILMDNMRGMPVGGNDTLFEINESDAEMATSEILDLTPTGFNIISTSNGINTNNQTYTYMAIRRGGMQTPTAASDVFHVNKFTSTGFTEYTGVGFAPDLAIQKAVSSGDNWDVVDKLRGPSKYIKTNSTDAEATDTQYLLGGFLNNGVKMGSETNGQFNGWNPNLHLYWRRARGYFDIVAYSGTGSARTVAHNLGAVPEMMWVKNRDQADNWLVYHSATGATHYGSISTNGVFDPSINAWNNTTPTSSVFTVKSFHNVNASGEDYIAYLFATVAGVSKVGSYTGDGNAGKQIDCGFTNGASFILIKRSDGTGNWFVWDSARGIVSGNDPYLLLNDTAAEEGSGDNVDPHDAGFIVNGPGNNVDGATHIFYAIAATS